MARLELSSRTRISATHLSAAPAAQPSAVATPEVMQRLNPFGAPGPWSERLPHFRPEVVPGPAGHLQSEYMVPRANATAAIAKLRSIGDRIDRHLWVSEIRSMAGDALWLSPCYGDDRVGIRSGRLPSRRCR
jgi:xylitol oxidase